MTDSAYEIEISRKGLGTNGNEVQAEQSTRIGFASGGQRIGIVFIQERILLSWWLNPLSVV